MWWTSREMILASRAYLLRNILKNYKSEKAAVPGVDRNVLHLLKVRTPATRTGTRCFDPLRIRRPDREQPAADCAVGGSGADALPRVVRPLPLPRPRTRQDHRRPPRGVERLSASDAFEVNPKTSGDDEGIITYVPMAALSESGMVIDQTPLQERQASTSVRFRNGDTLFARITPCLENGKTGFVQFLADEEVACGSTEFIILRAHVSNFFVYLTAREPRFRENAVRSMIGSSGRQRVQPSCFDRYFVPVPTDLLRTLFDDAVGGMFKQVANLDNQNRRLAQARDLLLPRLMKGEIAV